ncbi:MAG: glycoside hydrolase family 32 protein [Pseudomonadota bacterium]
MVAEAAQAVDPARRPVFHFTPRAGWMNDPNGPIYHGGQYHLFYQHNPNEPQWGTIHWGHATSPDLVTWAHRPPALAPDPAAALEHCFSGCSWVGEDGVARLFFTAIGGTKGVEHGAEQWSVTADLDSGSFVPIAMPALSDGMHPDPVRHWRDPFIFATEGRTFMVLGGSAPTAEDDPLGAGRPAVFLYEARDAALTSWRYRGVLYQRIDRSIGSIECPAFFPLSDSLGDKFVLIISPYGPVEWRVGTFDADSGRFVVEREGVMDANPRHYAATCFRDSAGRWLSVAWLQAGRAELGWNGALSLPRALTLSAEGDLVQTPAVSLEALSIGTVTLAESAVPCGGAFTLEIDGVGEQAMTLEIATRPDAATTAIRVEAGRIEINGEAFAPERGLTPCRLFFDRGIVEVFTAGGACRTWLVEDPGPKARMRRSGATDARALLTVLKAPG